MNIINSGMFLGDPESIETHLNNDWSLLLKNLKSREDCHFELLQYNHRIITQVREQNSQLFVNDEIMQHQREYRRMAGITQPIDAEEREIHEKYEGMSTREDGVAKLMGRVGARIIEICHSSLEKCKTYDQTLTEKHARMKKALIELLNQKDGIKFEQVIKCVTSYSREKLAAELEKLRKMTLALENGDYSKLKEVYYPKERKAKSVQRKLDVLRDLSKAKAEKESLKTQQKNMEKLRKQKQKIMNALYGTMQLSKQQHLDDEGQSPSQKAERLYNEILGRNKFNSDQITEFESKKNLFEEKVRTFTEYIQKENKKMTEVFIRKPLKKDRQETPQQIESLKVIIEPHSKSLMNELDSNIENIMTEGNIDPSLRNERRLLNTQQFKLKSVSTKKEINDLPNLFNSFVSTHENFSHFKFDPAHRDTFARINKNVLPDIGKGTSLDHKTQITKIKIDKILRTTIKNEDRGHEESSRKHVDIKRAGIISREQAKLLQNNFRFKMNFKNIDFGTECLKRNAEKHKQEPIPQDHSFSVKKAELKQYEPKLNLIF